MKYGLNPQKINVKETLQQDINITLPPHITSTFKGWKNSSLNVFQKYRNLTNQYIEGVYSTEPNNPKPLNLLSYTLQAPLHSTTKNIQKQISIQRLQTLWRPAQGFTKTIPFNAQHINVHSPWSINTHRPYQQVLGK